MREICLASALMFAACNGGDDTTNGVCGDSHVDSGEECDDGNATAGDGCSATCTFEVVCGNGHVDAGEQCDDGNALSYDGCTAACIVELCGNGTLDAGEACDDGNYRPADGCSQLCTVEQQYNILANWSIQTVGGTQQPCPTGFPTAALISRVVDLNGQVLNPAIKDLWDCSAGSGTTAPLYEGTYEVYLSIESTNGGQKYATSVPALLTLTSSLTYSTQILTDGGYFAFAWSLIGAMSNNALTCAQVPNIGGIELISTVSGTTTSVTDIFDCGDGKGVTAGLAAGTYTVSVSALDTNDLSIGTSPTLVNKTIDAPNKVTDLGTISIPIDGL